MLIKYEIKILFSAENDSIKLLFREIDNKGKTVMKLVEILFLLFNMGKI